MTSSRLVRGAIFLGVAQLAERVAWDHEAVRAGLTTQTICVYSSVGSSTCLLSKGSAVRGCLDAPSNSISSSDRILRRERRETGSTPVWNIICRCSTKASMPVFQTGDAVSRSVTCSIMRRLLSPLFLNKERCKI